MKIIKLKDLPPGNKISGEKPKQIKKMYLENLYNILNIIGSVDNKNYIFTLSAERRRGLLKELKEVLNK